jgi:hypothetical protein
VPRILHAKIFTPKSPHHDFMVTENASQANNEGYQQAKSMKTHTSKSTSNTQQSLHLLSVLNSSFIHTAFTIFTAFTVHRGLFTVASGEESLDPIASNTFR